MSLELRWNDYDKGRANHSEMNVPVPLCPHLPAPESTWLSEHGCVKDLVIL